VEIEEAHDVNAIKKRDHQTVGKMFQRRGSQDKRMWQKEVRSTASGTAELMDGRGRSAET
jgi:hypothetical protein